MTTTLSDVSRGTTEVNPPKVNWSQIMKDLHENGCSAYRVSLALGAADCTVRNWMKKGEPRYGYGRALLRLHAVYCGSALTTRRVTESEVIA